MRICVKEGLNQFKVSTILIDLSKYAIQGIAIENYVERRLIDAHYGCLLLLAYFRVNVATIVMEDILIVDGTITVQ